MLCPEGWTLDHQKKLDFITKMAKMGLEHVQHFDTGGLAGGISQTLGTANNFNAGSASITPGTNQGQLDNSYGQAQSGLGHLNAVTGALSPQIQQGVDQQSQLAQQFSDQANGIGPNVALTQLNQATSQNTANQAALMAGQRGAGQNAGLIARQAAQQGAANQQNAAGQAATLGAQQQIAAQQNLANLSSNQIAQGNQAATNYEGAVQGEQNILQNANSSANNAAVGMQSNVNNTMGQAAMGNQNVNTGIASGLAKGVSGGIFSFAKGGQVPGSEANASTTRPDAGFGTVTVYEAKGGMLGPEHGYMQRFATGGSPIIGNPLASPSAPTAPTSFAAQWLNSPTTTQGPQIEATGAAPVRQKSTDSQPKAPGQDPVTGSSGELPGVGMVTGDAMPAGSAAEAGGASDLLAEAAPLALAAQGGLLKDKMASKGGKVKAKGKDEKATVKGNSYDNDKIPALLSEGEIVLPREVTQHPNAPEMAAKFVAATLAKKKQGLTKAPKK